MPYMPTLTPQTTLGIYGIHGVSGKKRTRVKEFGRFGSCSCYAEFVDSTVQSIPHTTTTTTTTTKYQRKASQAPPRGRAAADRGHTAAGEDHGLWKFVDRGTGRWEVRQGTGGDALLHGAGAADAGIQNRCTQRVKRGRWEDLWDQE